MYPKELRYYKEHEWARVEADGEAAIGISFFAQEQLGDVVYVALPQVGAYFDQFAKFGEIESVKAVSDLFTPLSGQVVAVNEKLKETPELVNQEPYEQGWMLRVKMKDPSELKKLMAAEEYERMVSQEK